MKHIIWSSDVGNLKNWKDFLDEYYPDTDEYEQWELVSELNNDYLNDERVNLDVPCKILAIADLGFWNGRTRGFKFYDNIKEILNTGRDIEICEWFVEGDCLQSTQSHHDGCHYVTYYLVNEDKGGYNDFEDEVYATYGNIDQELLEKYCNAKTLADKVKAIYGWN